MDHIGIDVHKAQSQVCILTGSGERVEQRIPTDRMRFGEVFGGRAKARILIEAWTESEMVARSLEDLGHEVKTLGVVRDLDTVEQIHREWRPHIAFNMLEDVYGVIPYDHNMVSFLELLGMAYTGWALADPE